MTDTILTIKQIEDLFANLTLQMLGLDPAAPASQSRVRIAWPADGAPTWKINEDVAFLLINYDADPITQQMHTEYNSADPNNADRAVSYTRVLRVSWVFYGPNSFNDADTIRASLFLPQFKQLLAASNLVLIVDVPVPVRSPELYNSQWWERTSLYARFNELVIRHSTVPYLQSANVQVVKG